MALTSNRGTLTACSVRRKPVAFLRKAIAFFISEVYESPIVPVGFIGRRLRPPIAALKEARSKAFNTTGRPVRLVPPV